MITDVLSEAVLLATLALVAMPMIARKVRTAFRPTELTRFNASTLGSGLVLLTVALIACAVPVILALTGTALADRHFFPGDTAVGWISAGAVVTLVATAVIGITRTTRIERRLHIEPSVGLHLRRHDYTIVVLSSDNPIAYAVGHRHPQVVLTTGLISSLEVEELVSVVEHEAAHLQLNHRLHLRLISVVEPLSRIKPIEKLASSLRLALELAADAATSNQRATRTALLKTSGVAVVPGLAAFAAGDIIDRIEALDEEADTRSSGTRNALYLVAASLVAMSISTLAVFWL